MAETRDWRIELAQRIAPAYAVIPRVKAVVLVGGVARGRGDQYSDLDLAVFWEAAPEEAERRAALAQVEQTLQTALVIGGLYAVPVLGTDDDGMLWEDEAFIGSSVTRSFKIDIGHRTVNAMNSILNDVTQGCDPTVFIAPATSACATCATKSRSGRRNFTTASMHCCGMTRHKSWVTWIRWWRKYSHW